jgi:MFS family permease
MRSAPGPSALRVSSPSAEGLANLTPIKAPAPGRALLEHRGYLLALLATIAFLNGADQSVMAAVAAPIAREFRLDDSQLGVLGSAFIVVYAIAVLPFGAWADAGIRGRVIAAGVGIWSLATLASGLAPTYPVLLLARAAVGAGESAYLPAGNSLIGDLFRREERAGALAWVVADLRAGVGIGLIGGAAVAARLGWRVAFLFAGVPGLLLALIALRIPEPARGGAESVRPEKPIAGGFEWSTYGALLRIPTVLIAVATITFGLFATAGIGFWVPTFVERRFGLSVGPAGAVAGLPLLVGGLAGTFGSARLVDRLTRRRASGALEVTAVAFAIGGAFSVLAFSAGSLPLFVTSYLVTVTCLGAFIPAVQAIAHAVVIPTQRARAITLVLVVGNLCGNALAPYAVGVASDYLHAVTAAREPRSPKFGGCSAAGSPGREDEVERGRGLVLEALCQAGVWLVVLSTDARLRPALLSIASAEFGGRVSPGDVLDIEGWVESFDDESAVLSGRVSVDGATVLEARDIMCVLQPSERLEELEQTRRMEALLIRASAPA